MQWKPLVLTQAKPKNQEMVPKDRFHGPIRMTFVAAWPHENDLKFGYWGSMDFGQMLRGTATRVLGTADGHR
jgi:hypothetical protein